MTDNIFEMPRPKVKTPALPLQLLKELGVEGPSNAKNGLLNSKRGTQDWKGGPSNSRKERRKIERKSKKLNRAAPPRGIKAVATTARPQLSQDNQDDNDVVLEDDIEVEMSEDEGSEEIDEEGDSESGDNSDGAKPPPDKMHVPKAMRDKLAEDDAEIAELERKLGIKGRKKLPQSFNDDGLGNLLADIDAVFEDREVQERKKRKAEADEWLANKRRKAAAAVQYRNNELEGESDGSDGTSDDMDNMKQLEDFDGPEDESGFSDEGFDGNGESSGEESVDDESEFEGFDSEDGTNDTKQPKLVRENPYVAPVTGKPAAKYVPPSLRKETGSDAELAARVRRQTQGLVNRVTDANLVTVVGDIEKLYRDNPRQHVSSALVDLLLIQICEPTALPDTLLILNAGFATAVYKVIGMDFGAQLVQELVERFARYHDTANEAAVNRPDVSKETSNLITFLAQLYNFQLLGPKLLFDYIRLLLSDLSELNAELLLRIVRISGRALRHDDPVVLKDIVTLIQPAVSNIGEQNLSVRTKFMIETIHDLKNNKMKAGSGASAIVLEHVTRMKKTLGTLNSRKLKSTEPLRIGLKDFQESDKKGKWWLVGASWAGPSAREKKRQEQEQEEEEGEDDWLPDDLMETGPDIEELARQQMMNTDVRRSIFVAITLACDCEDAYARINKLRLNKHRKTEIPFVIMQCVGAEQHYNPYYTMVAQKLCSDHKIKWSFQNSLWKFFKRLGESIFGEDTDNVDDGEEIPPRRLVNNAKMFGTLVAEGTLSLGVLKCLNLPYLQAKTKDFVHVMLIIILQECLSKDSEAEATIANVFKAVMDAPELARGLQWFLRKVIRKTDLAGSKAEAKLIKEAGKTAEAVVEAVLVEDHGLGE